jgi:hypothetical protein
LEHHRLQESESCIKEVLFNYDTSPVFSVNKNALNFRVILKKKIAFMDIILSKKMEKILQLL